MPNFRARPIPVKLSDDLLLRIDQMAARLGEGRSTIMRIAMKIGLENLEKALDEGAILPSIANQMTEPGEYQASIAAEQAPPYKVKKRKAG